MKLESFWFGGEIGRLLVALGLWLVDNVIISPEEYQWNISRNVRVLQPFLYDYHDPACFGYVFLLVSLAFSFLRRIWLSELIISKDA